MPKKTLFKKWKVITIIVQNCHSCSPVTNHDIWFRAGQEAKKCLTTFYHNVISDLDTDCSLSISSVKCYCLCNGSIVRTSWRKRKSKVNNPGLHYIIPIAEPSAVVTVTTVALLRSPLLTSINSTAPSSPSVTV